jgi:peptide chain release factor 1
MLLRCVLKTFRRSFYSQRVKSLLINNLENYSKCIEENAGLKNSLNNLKGIISNISDVEKELASSGNDKELLGLMKEEKVQLEMQKEEFAGNLLDEIYSYEQERDEHRISVNSNCFFEISAGVGGKEAMLFANEMCNLYENYFDFKNWTIVERESDLDGGEYLRHFKATIEGRNIWDCLRYEAGVHRVQRVPKTERAGRIHTSTISVACIPFNPSQKIVILDKDLKMETKRASGAGGQHVNKTESAVRLTHLPSGISVESQEDKSQIKNRATAIKKLQKILSEQQMKETFEKYISTKKSQMGRSNRNEKIRTYNFPQDRMTDHRLSSQGNEEGTIFNLEEFFNSPDRLEDFIFKLRRYEQERELLDIFSKFEMK